MTFPRIAIRVLLIAVPLLGAWVWQWQEYRGQQAEHRRENTQFAQAILAAVEGVAMRNCRGGGFDSQELASTFEEMRARVGSQWVALEDGSGRILAEAGARPTSPGEEGAHDILRQPFDPPRPRGRGRGQWSRRSGVLPLPKSPMTLVLAHPRQALEEKLATDLRRFLLTATALSLCIVLASVLLLLRARALEVRSRLATSREKVRSLEFLSRLGAGLVHETKNPLGIVRGFAERLTQEDCDGVCVKRSAASIVAETDRTVARLDEFLLLSRPSAVRKRPFELQPFLEELAELVGPDLEQKKASISTPKTQAIIEGDREQARRLFLNLLLNASQALGDEGSLTIRCHQSADRLEIAVEDDGAGVPHEIRDSLFQPYVSARVGGTGLGLAIAKRIATDQGWDIRYEALPAGGSRFLVSLPTS